MVDAKGRRACVALLTVAGLVLLSTAAHAGWLAGYDYRQEITVNPSMTPGDLADFPLLVKITDPGNHLFGNASSAAGQDIVFTTANGVTTLPREIEHYSASGTRELDAWVKTNVSSAADTKLYMYYKGSDVPNSTDTWDSGFKMVQHLQETGASAGSMKDSTANANHGTPYSGAAISSLHTDAGQIDGAGAFDGSNDRIECGNDSTLSVGTGTWEAWIKPTSLTDHDYHTVVAKKYATAWWLGLYQKTGRIQLWTSGAAHQSTGAVTAGNWSHIVATWDGSTIDYYINGAYDSSNTETGAAVTNADNVNIGIDYAASTSLYQFTGTIDEVRISDAARDADWVKATYNNLNNPAGYVAAGAPQDNEWLPGWRYRQPITLSSAAADANLDGFPVLIKIDDAGNPVFANANSPGGHDIVFTRSDGVNLLPHEIEHYNNAGELDAWVKASLSATEDTTIYMYYGGPDAASSTDTWNANYKMVQHLQENPSGTAPQMLDSTANNNDGTCQGSLSAADQVPGQIDGSVDLNGSSDHIDCADNGTLDVGHGTWEAWVYPTSFTDHPYHTVVAKEYDSAWWFGLYANTGQIQLWTASEAHFTASGQAVPLNQWSHIAATWDGDWVQFYINGQDAGKVAETGSAVSNNDYISIGVDHDSHPGLYQFTGQLDEIRISDVAHSAEWIAASYNFQFAPGTYVEFGAQQIPEPATLGLLGLGAVALFRRRRAR